MLRSPLAKEPATELLEEVNAAAARITGTAPATGVALLLQELHGTAQDLLRELEFSDTSGISKAVAALTKLYGTSESQLRRGLPTRVAEQIDEAIAQVRAAADSGDTAAATRAAERLLDLTSSQVVDVPEGGVETGGGGTAGIEEGWSFLVGAGALVGAVRLVLLRRRTRHG